VENVKVSSVCSPEVEAEVPSNFAARFGKAYGRLALLFLNTVIFAVIVLAICDALPDWRSKNRDYFVSVFKPEFYATLSPDYVRQIALDHSYYQFVKGLTVAHPWTGFPTNRPIALETIHVDELGRRYDPRKPETLSDGETITIWFFGGSTMFGWGMPDEWTIPEVTRRKLQERFPDKHISVVNLGVPYYNSAHELALFTAHLRHETVKPNIVIFFDGLNDYAHSVLFGSPDSHFKTSERIYREWDDMQHDSHWFRLGGGFPIWKLREVFRPGTMQMEIERSDGATPQKPPTEDDFAERARSGVHWYQFNQKAALNLAENNGVEAFFVSQPQGPFYTPPAYLTYFFKSMKEGSPPDRFLDELELLYPLVEQRKPIYADAAGHYNDTAIDLIAADLAAFLEKRYFTVRETRPSEDPNT
jgi:hypothetical protein